MSDAFEATLGPGFRSWDRDDDAWRRLEAAGRDAANLVSAEGATASWRLLLRDLGPVFSGFGRYLATRADRIPAGLRSDLAAVEDLVTPAPWLEIRDTIESERGCRLDRIFVEIEEAPIEVRFPTQSHRAWLSPTDPVIVTCVAPSFEARIDRDLSRLPLLEPVMARVSGGSSAFGALVADYRAVLARRANIGPDVDAGIAVTGDARRFPQLLHRRAHAALCSRRVSVWDDIATVAPDSPGFDPAAAGEHACRTWLRQALLGSAFPEETTVGDFMIAGRRQVALGGRLFTAISAKTQDHLQGYLVAVAAGDPDLALTFLLRELVAGPSADPTGLRRRFRHSWSTDLDGAGGSELLAQMLLHWRLAIDHGYRPEAHLVSFYRGCLAAASAATEIGAAPDVLRDALDGLQLRILTRQAETFIGFSPTSARSVQEAAWQLATRITTLPVAGPSQGGRPAPSLATTGSLLLVLAALGVAAPRLAAWGAGWGEPAAAAAFAAIGAWTLRGILGRRKAT
jgi:hypothetical protein